MIIIILTSIFFIGTIAFGVLFLNYFIKLKKLTKSLISNRRFGYYEYSVLTYGVTNKIRIFVSEIERYTNGESKIELIRTEFISGYQSEYNNIIKNKFHFVDMRKSNEIEWLIVEDDIKEQRLKKLKELKLIK